jgi:hypothetical protein
MRDADLRATWALPAAASANTFSGNIDTGVRTSFGSLPDGVEAVVRVPALNTTILPDTRTNTITIESSDDPAFATFDTIATVVVTGAGGAGAGASEARAPIGPHNKRYIRGKTAFGVSTTTGAAVTAEFCLVF